MQIEKLSDWFIIKNIFFYSESNSSLYKEDYINLCAIQWDDVVYDKNQKKLINYRWEYEIRQFTILCIQTNGKLSFCINSFQEDDSFAIVSDIWAFEDNGFVENTKNRILYDKSMEDQISKLELEWRVYILN